jgi:hypothetical protein
MAEGVTENELRGGIADRAARANLELDTLIAVGADKLGALEHALQRSCVVKLDRAANHGAALRRTAARSAAASSASDHIGNFEM